MAGGSGVKTNERPGTRAVARFVRISPYKVREVLDIVRGKHVGLALEVLKFSERDAAQVIGKVLASAIANAENNDGLDPEDLYISACYADEGATIKRFRPRARGRAGKILKRTCHITVIVSRMPDDELRRHRSKVAAEQAGRRARRVAGGRRGNVPAGQEPGGDNRPGRFRRGGRRGDTTEEAELTTEEVADEAELEAEAVEEDTDIEATTETEVVATAAAPEADVITTDEATPDEVTTDVSNEQTQVEQAEGQPDRPEAS